MSFKNTLRRIATASIIALSLGATGCATFTGNNASAGVPNGAPQIPGNIPGLVVDAPQVPTMMVEAAANRVAPTKLPDVPALRARMQCWACR